MEEKNRMAQTPEEINQAVSDLADRIAEMDQARGVFGEILSDEELDDVAGGISSLPMLGYTRRSCEVCGKSFIYYWKVGENDPHRADEIAQMPKTCEIHRRPD